MHRNTCCLIILQFVLAEKCSVLTEANLCKGLTDWQDISKATDFISISVKSKLLLKIVDKS